MELAVGASESAMSSLLGKLGSLLAKEYTLISGVRSEIQYMNDELASMHAFLRKIGRAAAAGATHDEQTKDWIEQVRDVAYDIEDCVADLAHRLGRQPRGEGLLVGLRRAWYAMTTLWARLDIAAKIVDLKNRAQVRRAGPQQAAQLRAQAERPNAAPAVHGRSPAITQPAARRHDEAGGAGAGRRQPRGMARGGAG